MALLQCSATGDHSRLDKMSSVTIYTDGACRGNPGPGGWGAVLLAGKHVKEIRGAEPTTTNNRMELTAAICALAALERSCAVKLYTDSQYLRKGITEWLPQWKAREWRTADKKPVKNIDLWQALECEIERHTIEWHWVKGHAGNAGNERADRLANDAIDEMLKGTSIAG
jgi:ribonuclease HI